MDSNSQQTIVISGASKGIGAATALKLAGPGANLVINYLSDEGGANSVSSSCRDKGAQTLLFQGDVGQFAVQNALIETALGEFGRVDVLVNNAGHVKEELLALIDDADVNRMLATNISGVVGCSRAVLKPMLKQRSGVIINLSSVLATRPNRGNAVYAGTKGFVESFTKSLAIEVARKNVRVVAVAPGVINTSMSESVRKLASEQIKEHVAMRRVGTPEDVASVIAYLVSGEAAYITGEVVSVDGGYH